MRVKERFLRILGDVKIQKWPPFLYYEPGDYYKLTGAMADVIAKIIQPGDVVLRGYRNYLDGLFIPGTYSHTGIYAGHGRVVHAVAEGVCLVALSDFLRCDRACVLRPRSGAGMAIKRLRRWIGQPYDFDFKSGNEAFYCHELAAEAYRRLDVKKVIPYLGWLRFYKMEKKYLAESFINSTDFRKVIEFNPGGTPENKSGKENRKMKKTILTALIAAGTVSAATGCSSIYEAFHTTPSDVHDLAVQKVSDYAEAAVNRKIASSENLTPEGKAKLQAEVAKLKAEILEKIAEIKAKTEEAKKTDGSADKETSPTAAMNENEEKK